MLFLEVIVQKILFILNQLLTGDNMKNTLIIILFFNAIHIYSLEVQLDQIQKRKPHEPAELLPIILFDNEFNHSNMTELYVQKYYDHVRDFLNSIETGSNIKLLNEMIGTWYLRDINNKTIERGGKYETAYRFFIKKEDNRYVYYIGGTKTTLYIDSDGIIYFMSPWWGVLMKMLTVNNKLYIYYLEKDFWILDDIHNRGEYFYLR
jgi:hypothetical protein